jgi:hypothetical protein
LGQTASALGQAERNSARAAWHWTPHALCAQALAATPGQGSLCQAQRPSTRDHEVSRGVLFLFCFLFLTLPTMIRSGLELSIYLEHLHSDARRGPRHAFFSSGRYKSAQSRPRIIVFTRIWAFIHPASLGHPRPSGARSGTPDERNAREKARKIPPHHVAPTCWREWAVVVLIISSSAHRRLPHTHHLPRAVKAAADGRPATRRGELMPARLYNAAYLVWPATFASSHLPQSTCPPRPLTSSSSSNGGLPIRR